MKTRGSLLIVDDDEALAGKMAELLRMDGYDTTVSGDGLHALRLLDAGFNPDVILLDMHLPGVTGWDVAAELRAIGYATPIIVITADPNPRACARQIGTDIWLAKPFGANELYAAVETMLALQRPPEGLQAQPGHADI